MFFCHKHGTPLVIRLMIIMIKNVFLQVTRVWDLISCRINNWCHAKCSDIIYPSRGGSASCPWGSWQTGSWNVTWRNLQGKVFPALVSFLVYTLILHWLVICSFVLVGYCDCFQFWMYDTQSKCTSLRALGSWWSGLHSYQLLKQWLKYICIYESPLLLIFLLW